ncbi:hypothetical protein BN1723_019872, partial [Verticillium longisporum]
AEEAAHGASGRREEAVHHHPHRYGGGDCGPEGQDGTSSAGEAVLPGVHRVAPHGEGGDDPVPYHRDGRASQKG